MNKEEAKQLERKIRQWRAEPWTFVKEMWPNFTPYPWQAELLRALPDHLKISIRSGHGVGKAHPNNIIVDTPNGKKEWGSLIAGDLLFDADGDVVKIKSTQKYQNIDIYRVKFDDGSFCDVSSGHLWNVKGRQERRNNKDDWRTLSTLDILNFGVKRKNGISWCNQWEIPMHQPVNYKTRDVPVHPYTLGVWLGDGARNMARITSADMDVIDKLQSTGAHVSQIGKYGWGIKRLMNGLKELNVFDKYSYEKSVPDVYKYNDILTRSEILRGLLDTDGEANQKGTVIFSSTSLQLANDVVWLARSLGGKAQFQQTIKKPFFNDHDGNKKQGRDCWRVTLRMPENFKCFYIQRKQSRIKSCEDRYRTRWIESIELIGKSDAMCVEVDNDHGLYLANDFIVTHNSTIVSIIIIWYLMCHYPCKIPITAPSSTQLRDVLWAEIKSWRDKMHPTFAAQLEMNSEMVWVAGLRGQATAMARTARKENPEAFQGIHAKYVLFIVDEASGIDEKIFEAGEGALSTEGARVILIGNPTRLHGTFYNSHHRDRADYFTMHVNGEDVAGVGKKFIEEMKRKYGEHSDIYNYRVKGNFPKGSIQQVIPLSLCESAVNREIDHDPHANVIWGIDVARQGKDRSTLSKRQGKKKLGTTRWWRHEDIMDVVGEVVMEYRTDMKAGIKLPKYINIDCIGYGAGLSDRLRQIFKEEGWDRYTKIVDVDVNLTATSEVTKKDYNRLRDQLWFAGREWFMGEDVCIDDEPDLIAELTCAEYGPHKTSCKILVASKDEMKDILGMSPDLADSFLLTLYQPPAEPEVRIRILC